MQKKALRTRQSRSAADNTEGRSEPSGVGHATPLTPAQRNRMRAKRRAFMRGRTEAAHLAPAADRAPRAEHQLPLLPQPEFRALPVPPPDALAPPAPGTKDADLAQLLSELLAEQHFQPEPLQPLPRADEPHVHARFHGLGLGFVVLAHPPRWCCLRAASRILPPPGLLVSEEEIDNDCTDVDPAIGAWQAGAADLVIATSQLYNYVELFLQVSPKVMGKKQQKLLLSQVETMGAEAYKRFVLVGFDGLDYECLEWPSGESYDEDDFEMRKQVLLRAARAASDAQREFQLFAAQAPYSVHSAGAEMQIAMEESVYCANIMQNVNNELSRLLDGVVSVSERGASSSFQAFDTLLAGAQQSHANSASGKR